MRRIEALTNGNLALNRSQSEGNRRIIGSEAFDLEYRPEINRQSIKDDLKSYLGEYRFQLPRYSYNLSILNNELCNPETSESMADASLRSIDKKRFQGQSVTREKAEYEGFKKISEQLMTANTGDVIIWASPPGPKEEGYGDYGFLFIGEIDKTQERVSMEALRLESPTIDQYVKAVSEITGEGVGYKVPEEFLKNPRIVSSPDFSKIETLVRNNFHFIEDKEKKVEFENIMNKADHLVEQVIDVIQNGTEEEKIKALFTFENYVIELKKREKQGNVIYSDERRDLESLSRYYSHTPPPVKGSCGSTETKSANIIGTNISSFLEDDKYGSRTFNCPKCGAVNIRPFGELLSACQHCGSEDVSCE